MIVFRPSARALITDPDGRILLLRVRDAVALDASDPVTDYWITVGGGVEPAETFETARAAAGGCPRPAVRAAHADGDGDLG